MRELAITELEAGQRLDRFLRKLLPTVPLGAIFRMLRSGAIRIDGKKVAGSLRLVTGTRVQLALPAGDVRSTPGAAAGSRRTASRAGELPAALRPRVVHQDEHLLVLGKPAGLAVHGGSGVQHSVTDWLAAQPFGARTATFAPAPAHRLDRGTAGLLVVGLTPAALRALTASFRTGEVRKVYHAVVHGVPVPDAGVIDAPLAEVDAPRADGPKVVVQEGGQPATTRYTVVAARARHALLRVEPQEGRQHQIRAHLAHRGHPIVGDRRYGAPASEHRGFLLHCSELAFPHPHTGAPFVAREPVPLALRRLVGTD